MRRKARKAWMVKGSADLAPFYGWAWTRKRLVERLKDQGLNMTYAKIVRVTVSEE